MSVFTFSIPQLYHSFNSIFARTHALTPHSVVITRNESTDLTLVMYK